MRALVLALLLLPFAANAAITMEDFTTATTAVENLDEITIDTPTIANDDYVDVIVGLQHQDGSNDSGLDWSGGTETGFTLIAQFPPTATLDQHIVLFRKKITDAGSEPATYTFSHADGAVYSIAAIAIAWRGVDLTTSVDATGTATGSGGTSTTATFTGFNTATDGAVFVGAVVARRALTVDYSPDSMTEIAEATGGDAADVSNRVTVAAGYITIATAGASGTKTATLSAARENSGLAYALRPAVGGGGGSVVPIIVQQH